MASILRALDTNLSRITTALGTEVTATEPGSVLDGDVEPATSSSSPKPGQAPAPASGSSWMGLAVAVVVVGVVAFLWWKSSGGQDGTEGRVRANSVPIAGGGNARVFASSRTHPTSILRRERNAPRPTKTVRFDDQAEDDVVEEEEEVAVPPPAHPIRIGSEGAWTR